MAAKRSKRPPAKRDSKGRIVKGHTLNPSGRHGPNRATIEIRKMIHEALDEAGGVAYLTAQAHENPVAFMGLLGKVIPKDHRVSGVTLAELVAGSWAKTIDVEAESTNGTN